MQYLRRVHLWTVLWRNPSEEEIIEKPLAQLVTPVEDGEEQAPEEAPPTEAVEEDQQADGGEEPTDGGEEPTDGGEEPTDGGEW